MHQIDGNCLLSLAAWLCAEHEFGPLSVRAGDLTKSGRRENQKMLHVATCNAHWQSLINTALL
jgi:hypothetical protein